MSKTIELIKAFFLGFKSQRDTEAAFLAESADVCDLERRLRLIDSDRRDGARGLLFGTQMP